MQTTHGFGVSHRRFGGFSLLAAPGSLGKAVSWQRQPPRPGEAGLQPLCSWKEAWMCPEQAQGRAVRSPSVLLKTFPLFRGKRALRWVVGMLGILRTPSMGGDLLPGAWAWCLQCSLSQPQGKQSHSPLPGSAETCQTRSPPPAGVLPCWVFRERQVFN